MCETDGVDLALKTPKKLDPKSMFPSTRQPDQEKSHQANIIVAISKHTLRKLGVITLLPRPKYTENQKAKTVSVKSISPC